MNLSKALLAPGALALALAVSTAPAFAHQFWLAPLRYDPARGVPVEIGAVAGTGFRGERLPWSPAHVVRLVARSSRLIDLARATSPGDPTWVRFAPADDAGTLVAF